MRALLSLCRDAWLSRPDGLSRCRASHSLARTSVIAGLAGLALLSAPSLRADDEAAFGGFLGDLSIDGGLMVEAESAFRWNDSVGQMGELRVTPELRVSGPEGFSLVAIARGRGDIFDELEPGQPDQGTRSPESRRLLIGDDLDLELREFFLEGYLGEVFARLGKQQIVWGQADGLKVLDVVNPQSFREFILDDFADSRIPLWSALVEVPVSEATLQLVWLPDQTYNDIPDPGAAFEPTSSMVTPSPLPGFTVVRRDPDRPSGLLTDSDLGARLSGFVDGWDLSLNYLSHYPDTPGFFLSPSVTPTGPVVTVTPRYERSHLIGGTFSNAFGELVLRGEAAFSTNRLFVASPTGDPDGVAETDELGYVLGLDWYGLEDTLLSAQAFQSITVSDPTGMVRDRVDTNFTFLARHDLLDGDLTLDVIWLTNVNQADGLLRPKVNYKVTDELDVWLGLDVFYGDGKGLFGQFDDQDRVVTGVKWRW